MSCPRPLYEGPGGHTMRKCLSDNGDVTVDDNAMIENDDGTKDNGYVMVDNATNWYTHKIF